MRTGNQMSEVLTRTAAIDETGTYRYALTRSWDANKPWATFVMLNPSTADAGRDDPTIRRCIGFAGRWGCGSLLVLNLFALRATDPRELAAHRDPVGPQNDEYLAAGARQARASGASSVVAAWGAHREANRRAEHVQRIFSSHGLAMTCLGRTGADHPKHPLARGVHRIPDDAVPEPWSAW